MKKAILFLLLTFSTIFSQNGNYLHLNGVDAYATILDNEILRLAETDFTIEANVLLYDFNNWYQSIIFGKRFANVEKGYYCSITGEAASQSFKPFFQKGGGLTDHLFGNETINTNQWYHLCFKFEKETNTLSIYVNGELDSQNTNFHTLNNDNHYDISIGKEPEKYTYFLNGQIDELRIWNYPRTQQQINTYKNSEIDYTDPNESYGLLAYYKFDEAENLEVGNDGLADDIRDYGPYGFHADMNGGAEITNITGNIAWSTELVITDASGNLPQSNLKFGQHPDATNGLDVDLGESDLPPVPPVNAFDVRFILSDETTSLIDYKNSEEYTTEWIFELQPGEEGFPIYLSWDMESLPEGKFILSDHINGNMVYINMKEQNSLVLNNSFINSLVITKSQAVVSKITMNSGWNIASVPFQLPSMCSDQVFEQAASDVYAYNFGFETEDTVKPGKGYLVKYEQPTVITVNGLPHSTDVSVHNGWNLIGPFHKQVFREQITTSGGADIQGYFFSYNGGYQVTYAMHPGNGYWLYAYNEGVLHYNNSGEVTGKPLFEESLFLNICQADGKNFNLYVTEDQEKVETLLIPPVIEDCDFDARFNEDKLFELKDSPSNLKIIANKFPVIIRASGGEISFYLNGNVITLHDSEEYTINNINELTAVNSEYDPENISYQLFDCYPNPFNPETTIRFSVPDDSKVEVSVFNTLGERVSILTNKLFNKGTHNIKFNASALPSGVYFYRIVTDKFTTSKKMILLK